MSTIVCARCGKLKPADPQLGICQECWLESVPLTQGSVGEPTPEWKMAFRDLWSPIDRFPPDEPPEVTASYWFYMGWVGRWKSWMGKVK